MTTFYTVVNWLVILGYWLLIAGVTLRILMKRRAVPSAMAWLLIIYILPLVGIIAYLSFGELHLGKRRAERARAMWPSTAKWLNDLKACKHIFAEDNSPVAESLFKLCERRQGIGGVKGNQLQLLTESDDVMQALIRDIQLARHNIEMVFYIWQPGGMADSVAESLMAAARRGVHCRLMLDSAGSVAFFRSPWAAMMRNAGIEVVEALKVNLMRVFLRRMDLRQHRKMVMIDNYIAYTGSMNMVDPRYFKQDSGVGQWIDLMARMEGPVATSMGIVYSCDWEIETGKRILPPPPDVNIMPFEEASGHTIHTIASGPGFPEDLIHQALLTAAYAAKEHLIMTTPYFVPSDDLLHAICTAAQRGVDVGGLDAVTHALEAYVSVLASEFSDGQALQALKLLKEYLPASYHEGSKNPVARERVHSAATIAGIAFANAFLGVCHSMAHKLGSQFHIPHGLANALLICNVIRYNANDNPTKQTAFSQYDRPQARRRYAEIADHLGLSAPGDRTAAKIEKLLAWLESIKAELGIPKSIREAGVQEADFLAQVDKLSEDAFDDQCTGANPRYPLISELKQILLDTYYGREFVEGEAGAKAEVAPVKAEKKAKKSA